MRSLVFRFEDIAAFSAALDGTPGALTLPDGETVVDGEWILAIFEIGSKRRATAAAARAVNASGDPHIAFERRDWDRLASFVSARTLRPAGMTGPPSGRWEAAPVSTRIPAAIEQDPLEEPFESRPTEGPVSVALESSRVSFGGRVLLFDGDPQTPVLAMLTEVGLEVDLVVSSAAAEQKMREILFDALVVDYRTADDALGFVRTTRKDPMSVGIPVLLLSEPPSSRDVVAMFASGADDFMPKPFRAPELGARIFGLLRRARLAKGTGGGRA